MELVIDNLRLAELVAIVRQNESFFDSFVLFLVQNGYADIHAFINEPDDRKALAVIEGYFQHAEKAVLYDEFVFSSLKMSSCCRRKYNRDMNNDLGIREDANASCNNKERGRFQGHPKIES